MGSQVLLKLGQKRSQDHLINTTSASEVITLTRLETDQNTPSRPHLASLSPWSNTSASSPMFTQMGLGGTTVELPRLNRSGGIPFAKYSRVARFSETDAGESSNASETKRLMDSLTYKATYPAHPREAISASENGYQESEYNRQQLLSVYGRGLEQMRRALGKDLNRSGEDSTRQVAVNKFTLMGEQVDKTMGPVSSESLQEMPPPAPRLNTNPPGLSALSPYYYEPSSLNSDKVIPPYPTSALSRAFYRDSLADRCGNSSILFGGNMANANASVGLKMGRSTSSSTLLSFEASKAAMQKAMRNTGKSLAETETSKSALKSVPLRKREKENSNIFPANVKSLLSTGIFDGVSVKYVSWDRTKHVRGTIQGTSYLCWCKECKKTKMVNAYQLEQHAGSKSKHPNDHIYFSNGKSIYGVVQELKNTPSDKLLEVIPTVTGCGINVEKFSKWKESFQAAGRELQRIFGSDPEPSETSSSKNEVPDADTE